MDEGSSSGGRVRGDFIDEATISGFVGRVEPGDHVSLATVLWSVALSVALLAGCSLWWAVAH